LSSVAIPPRTRLTGRARALPALRPELLYGVALALALAAVGLRAGGGLLIGPTTKIEMTLDVVGGVLGATAALAAGARRWWGAATIGWFGLLAILTALSITWALQPSDAWLEADRTIAWMAVLAGGVVLARIGGAWWGATLSAICAATAVVCGWAILTKVFPGLAPDEIYARLREPFGYWNAVGLTAALGVPPTLWLGARRSGHAAVNALAHPIMGLLLLTVLLAYSRGSLLAVVVGCAFWFSVVPLRLRGVAVLASGAAGALVVAAWVFAQDTLTKDKVTVSARAVSGHEFGIATVAMLLVLLVAGLAIGFAVARRAPSAGARRRAGAGILVLLALVPVALVVALSLSSKGLGGSISSGWRALTNPNDETKVANRPDRLTSVGSVRARYWNESYKIWQAHKLQGVGAGGYATARLRFRSDQLAVRHAHGYVVQTAADLGVLGLLASFALLVSWALATGRTLGWRLPLPAAARRVLGRPPPAGPRPAVARGPEFVAMATLATIVLVFGVHSFVDWTWFVPGTVVIALLAAGWVAGRGPLGEPAGDPRDLGPRVRAGVRSPLRAGVAALVLALGVLAAWTAWEPLGATSAGNAALLAAGPDAKSYAKARALAETARSRNPLSPDPLFELAVIENVAGHKDAAQRALTDAVRLQPSNPATWEQLSRFALDQQNDPRLALRLLGPALYLDPKSPTGARDYLDALRLVSQQAEQQAQREAAAKAKKQARRHKRHKKATR
jgi:hypothetical protein